MAKAVFGIAKSESQAIAIADQLRAAAFPRERHFRSPSRQAGDQGFRARATYERLPKARRPPQLPARFWEVRWDG